MTARLFSDVIVSTFLTRENLNPNYDRSDVWNNDTYGGHNGESFFPGPGVDQESSAFDHLFWNYPSGIIHAWVWKCIVNCHRILNASSMNTTNRSFSGFIDEKQMDEHPLCKKYFLTIQTFSARSASVTPSTLPNDFCISADTSGISKISICWPRPMPRMR